MSSEVPPNTSAAFRALLLLPSTFRTYLGGEFVHTPEVPAGTSMPTRRVAFRFNGGPATEPDAPIRRLRVNVRYYDTSHQLAEKLYMHGHARVHGLHSQAVTVGSERVAFYRIGEDVPASQLEEPQTGWPYIFVVYGITVATRALA